MRIRPIGTADLDDVAALLKSAFDSELRPYLTYAQDGIEAFLRVRVARPEQFGERTYLVGSDGSDRAVGYAEFVEIEPGVQFLSYICVAPHMQRRGIATSLIAQVLESRQGVSRVELEVLEHNVSALATYRRLGFDQVGGGRTWSRRLLPSAASAPATELVIPELAVYEPMHAAYGFSELPVRWRDRAVKLGRIGSTVLRCFDPASFVDEDLLAAVRRAFPGLSEAFLVTESEGEIPESALVIAKTIRMARSVERAVHEGGEVE